MDLNYAEKTLAYLYQIWSRPVHLETVFDEKRVLLTFDGERNTVADCVHSDRSKINAIIDEPSDYYLMLHTTPHHAGALRGQLD